MSFRDYMIIYKRSIEDPERFWEREAEKLIWRRKWSIVRSGERSRSRWFLEGELSVYENLIEKHTNTEWIMSKPAIIWEDEDYNTRIIFYSDLRDRSLVISKSLSEYGVGRGDWVIFYATPSIEVFEIFLAAIYLGAAVEFIFTGFGVEEVKKRIFNRKARHIVVVDGFFRKRRSVNLLRVLEEAIEKNGFVRNVFVVERIGVSSSDPRIVSYNELLKGSVTKQDHVKYRSTEPLIGLHVGYEEDFKPITHPAGGYLVQVYSTSKWIGLRPRDTYFCTVWPGWITAYSYIFFGPLMIGSTIILYEGAPDHPSWERWFEILENYSVTLFLTTSGALRILRRNIQDPLKKFRLDTLRAVLTTAEPLERDVWFWTYRSVGTGTRPIITSDPVELSGRIPVINLYIQSEIATFATGNLVNYVFPPILPGSAGPPIPGFHIEVLDENNNSVIGSIGRLIIRNPWPSTPIEAPEEFHKSWDQGFYDTGDLAIMNENKYVFPLGRRDSVLKISGYRISPGALIKTLMNYSNKIFSVRVARKYDELRFETPVIYYVGEEDPDNIRRIIREKLTAIAEPREIISA